jgi:hypothetical protein
MDTSNLLTFRVSLLDARYEKARTRTQFLERVLDQLGHLPRVRAASAAGCVPFTGGCYTTSVNIEGRPPAKLGEAPSAAIQIVMPGYFYTLGIPLKSGRDFTVADNIARSPYRFMVNDAFVKRYLRGEQALGKKISVLMENQNPYGEVIGVVANARELSIDREAKATVYYVYAHLSDPGMYFLVRVDRNPIGLAEPARRIRGWIRRCPLRTYGPSRRFLARTSCARDSALGCFRASPPWPWCWRQSEFMAW